MAVTVQLQSCKQPSQLLKQWYYQHVLLYGTKYCQDYSDSSGWRKLHSQISLVNNTALNLVREYCHCVNAATSCQIKNKNLKQQQCPFPKIIQRLCLGLFHGRAILFSLFLNRFPEEELFSLWLEGLLLCHSGIPHIKIKQWKGFKNQCYQRNQFLFSVTLSGIWHN